MKGRTPKPTALKVITGNPGKRSSNKQEPDPEYLMDLEPPVWLHASAKDVWNEVAPHLAAAKLLTQVDVQALAMGCIAIAQYRQAVRVTGDDLVKSKVVLDEDEKPVAAGEHLNPWLIVQSMSFKQAMAIFQQFGMSPAARTRIAIQPQGDLFGHGNSQKQGAGRFFT
jgi:P27 family predicted phage terminase small subunit